MIEIKEEENDSDVTEPTKQSIKQPGANDFK